MPRPCSICTHPDRAAIDAALISGDAYKVISSSFGVSEKALQRHKADHMTDLLAKASAAETVAADDLLVQVQHLQASTLSILRQAESEGTSKVALAAVREARGNIELLAKLTHQLNDRPTINILVASEWLTVRALLLDALAPYPDARLAVAERLQALESGQ